MNKTKIAVIGSSGFVGRAAVKFFKKSNEFDVIEFDLKTLDGRKHSSNWLKVTKMMVNKCDVAVICLQTPVRSDGFDISAILETFEWLEVKKVIIKSTMDPRSALECLKPGFDIVFNPEFIGESTYYIPESKYFDQSDIAKSPWHIFGSIDNESDWAIDLYETICGPAAKYIKTSVVNAVMAKLMSNAWAATKIIWANEMFDLCESSGMNWHDIRELWALNPFFERMHSSVFKNKRGFSGKCLPKDVKGLIAYSKKLKGGSTLIEIVDRLNKTYQGLNSI